MKATHEEVLAAGVLEVRPHEGLATAGGRALTLSVRELGLLVALVRRRGGIVRREDLYAQVWGRELRPGDRSIDVYVHKLRVKLETAVPDTRFIHTHVGFGYRLDPEPLSHDVHTTAADRPQAPDADRFRSSGAPTKTKEMHP